MGEHRFSQAHLLSVVTPHVARLESNLASSLSLIAFLSLTVLKKALRKTRRFFFVLQATEKLAGEFGNEASWGGE